MKSPATLDFAVASPQRQEALAVSGQRTGGAAAAYARHKEAHLGNTWTRRHLGLTGQQLCIAVAVRYVQLSKNGGEVLFPLKT